MADPIGTLLLASGLSVLKANSFSRQLALLKRFLELTGTRVLLAGRAPGSAGGKDIFDIPDFSTEAVNAIVSKSGVNAIILLGYPDQFPFLRSTTPVPVYLWYQCSRPIIPPGLESPVVVPLTERTAAHLEHAGLPRSGPVIPHGVDTALFMPAASTDALDLTAAAAAGRTRKAWAEGPILLSVGANSGRKRFDLLIDAFSRAKKRLPEARLFIKTDSSNKAGGFDLEELATRHGVSGAVKVISGESSDEEMVSVYVSSDIYIHTAEWEGFCIPVIEAMACGLPVITHPVQGPGELVPYPALLVPGSRIVRDGEVALLMADPESFANTIARYAEDPELIRYTSIEGRRAAVERFDIRRVVEQWLMLLSFP